MIPPIDLDEAELIELVQKYHGNKLIHVRAIIIKHYNTIVKLRNQGFSLAVIHDSLVKKKELTCSYVQFTKVFNKVKKLFEDQEKDQQQKYQSSTITDKVVYDSE